MENTTLKVAFGLEQFPLKLGKFELACFILENKQIVILKSSIQKAFGYDGRSETWLIEILGQVNKFIPVTSLTDQCASPIKFELRHADKSISIAEGLSPEFFLKSAILLKIAKEQGFLNLNQLKYSKSAEAVLKHISEDNILSLIYKSTGYTFYKENSLAQFSKFLTTVLEDQAFQWLNTFPEAFFEKLFALHQTDWNDLREKPQITGKLVHEIVFSRLPEELLTTLRNNAPKRSYTRKQNKQQETMHPQLKEYISNVMALIKASGDNWNIFTQLLGRSYPKNPAFTTKFPTMPDHSGKKTELSAFNKKLFDLS